MALQIPFVTDSGVNAPESYWKVTTLYIEDISQTGYVIVSAYYNATMRLENKAPLTSLEFQITKDIYPTYMDDNNLIGGAYSYLKTLPQFSNAADV